MIIKYPLHNILKPERSYNHDWNKYISRTRKYCVCVIAIVVCLMLVSVGEKSESMICVSVNGRGWVVPLSELNKAFTCFDEVKTLWK